MSGAGIAASGMAVALGAICSALPTFMEVVVAAVLFAARQPRREHFAIRMAGGLAIVFAFFGGTCITTLRSMAQAGLVTSLEPVFLLTGSGAASVLGGFIVCCLALVATVLLIWECFDVSPQTALFCGTAGYALQNLSSGIAETISLAWTNSASMPLTLACCAAVYLVTWRFLIRDIDAKGVANIRDWRILFMVVVVMFAVIGFDIMLKSEQVRGTSTAAMVALRLFHCLICLFTLLVEVEMVVNRQLRVDAEATQRLLAESERQYELSRENIEAINIKCHDLRHQIRHLADGSAGVVDQGALDDLASEVNVYDSQVRTGNDALDTILTEKSLICEHEHITLTCIADGAALARMAPSDLYAFFGNALDNAIEAVEKLDDPELRTISLVVRKRAGMASIHVENFYDPSASAREFKDGLPLTSKADRSGHGFGTRSMRAIAERYGGTLSIVADAGTGAKDASREEAGEDGDPAGRTQSAAARPATFALDALLPAE